MQKLLTFFFSKNSSIYAIFNDKIFNDTLTNDIVSFEQLGPGLLLFKLFRRFFSVACYLQEIKKKSQTLIEKSLIWSWE